MSSTDTEVLIIGAGVVGLACAAESAQRGFQTLLIERHPSFGQEASSRNSEVIHSGIYYTPGSLKARFCVPANANLYIDCEKSGVWHRRCGKLVVAVTEDEERDLNILFEKGKTNGVQNLQMLTAKEARSLEPHIQCCAALLVPSTGIIDSHELMKAYLLEAQSGGADIVFGTEFSKPLETGNHFRLLLKERSGESFELTTKFVINAAGLSCDTVAQSFGIDIDTAGYRLYPNRGHYFRVSSSKSKLVSRLIYPMPFKHLLGLGIHITLDKAGQMKLGPDNEYCHEMPAEDRYKFDETKKEKFFTAVKSYFPPLELEDLTPDQIGIRAKPQKPGEGPKDFIINEESNRGVPGLINLIGIESPGLTCSREIARYVFDML